MADFSVRATSGVQVLTWIDPATASRPSRLNAANWPHRYMKLVLEGLAEFSARPNGLAEGPPDASLGGRLFSVSIGERPVGSTFDLTNPPGFTSIARFVPHMIGHYLLVFSRPGGGAVGLHLTVEAS